MQNFRSIARRRHLSSKHFIGQKRGVKQPAGEKIEEPQIKKTTKQPKVKPVVGQVEEVVVSPESKSELIKAIEDDTIVENKE